MESKLLKGGLPACPVLHVDEDFDDWLSITASLYSSDCDSLLDTLATILDWPRNLFGEVERPKDLKRLAENELRHAFDTPARFKLSRSCKESQAYCPLCFATDLRIGYLPYFREDWGNLLSTMCRAHRTPLFRWSSGTPRNPKGLPNWMTANYRLNRPLARRADRLKEIDKYRIWLRLGRLSMSWHSEICSSEFVSKEQGYVLDQQMHWEIALNDPSRYDLIRGVAGNDGKAFRRAFDDLCIVYLAKVNAVDWEESHPLQNCRFMGPSWLFSVPKRQPLEIINMRAPLERIPNPAQRRSVIALVMRTFMGFSADLACDDSGMITDAGETALTRDLRNLSSPAKDFLSERSNRWPPFVRAGIRRAIR